MNTSENTRLDSTIFNDADNQNTIPPVPQPGAPVPPPIPAPDAFASSTFGPDATGDAPMSYDTVGYSTADSMATQQPVVDADEKNRRKNVAAALAAGIGGVGIGAAAVMLSSFKKNEPDTPRPADDDKPETLADQTTDGEIPVAHNVTDDMSFSEAFAAARAEVGSGGTFSWHGQVYSTYTAEEWNAMSAQEQAAFNDHFTFFQGGGGHGQSTHAHSHGDHVAETHHSDNGGETHHNGETHSQTPNQTGPRPTAPTVQTTPQSTDHHVVEVGDYKMEVDKVVHDEDGGVTATGHVNGHVAMMVDIDGDGKFDGLFIDENDDGEVGRSEIVNLQQSNINISVAQVESQINHETPAPPTPQPAFNMNSQAIVVHDEETGKNLAIMKDEDGHDMYMVDDDGDQTFDYVWADINGDGKASPEEILSLKDTGYTVTVSDLGGFTPQEQLAQMQAEADGTLVAQEVSTGEDRGEESQTDDDDDVVVADPDDDTMPPVTDGDDPDYVTIVETGDSGTHDDVTIVDPDETTMPPVTEEPAGQTLVAEDVTTDTADSDIAMVDTADVDSM